MGAGMYHIRVVGELDSTRIRAELDRISIYFEPLDEDRKAMTRIGVLEFPLFQFYDIQQESQTQIELQYDLAGALGFKLHGYNPSLQTK